MPKKSSSRSSINPEISKEIKFLGSLLGEVIQELSGKRIFQLEEKIRKLAIDARANKKSAKTQLRKLISSLKPHEAYEIALAFATYFELVNIAEENHRIRVLKQRELRTLRTGRPQKESIFDALLKLKKSSKSADVQEILENLRIELVFTAHPTEAKRRTLLSKISRIAGLLEDERPGSYSEFSKQALKREIASMWLTSRARLNKPEVMDEVRTGLWYFSNSLFEVLPELKSEMNLALKKTFPKLKPPNSWIGFGSWIGGDRDGHPDVTDSVTEATLASHRQLSSERIEQKAAELSQQLSFSDTRLKVDAEIQTILNYWRKDGELNKIISRYQHEPFRAALLCLSRTASLLSEDQLVENFQILDRVLSKTKVADQFRGFFVEIWNHLEFFGNHTAVLDLRQESEVHEEAMADLMKQAGLGASYLDSPDVEKQKMISQLLQKNIHFDRVQLDKKTALFTVLSPLRVIAKKGSKGAGVYIISMTHSASHFLEVLAFQKVTGANMPIVPLFETRLDLQNADRIMREAMENESYREFLKGFNNEQMVMLGYSDSNKDAGYTTAAWEIYEAQERLVSLFNQSKVKFSFFHGRGGTIARGGGPAARAILSQPKGLAYSKIRITEQGEILSTRYQRKEIAKRVLGQITYGSLLASANSKRKAQSQESKWHELFSKISEEACRKYESFIKDNPKSIEFWKQITPIEFIKELKIGSRPSSRRETQTVKDLRAIPWVFSWLQTRFVLPGWFGLGSGLQSVDNLSSLKAMYKDWSFFKAVIDNAQLTMAKADLSIAETYTELCDLSESKEIYKLLSEEYELTRSLVCKLTGQRKILDNEKVLQKSIQLRNPYVDPLNYIQVEMIKRYRKTLAESEKNELARVIELSIGGISSGLRNTG